MSHFADEFATLVARKLVSEFSFLPPKIMLSSQKLTLEFTLHGRRPSIIIALSPSNGSNIQLGMFDFLSYPAAEIINSYWMRLSISTERFMEIEEGVMLRGRLG